jgi:four helix bundle protein|tara:strand:+ start:244 stop:609 length:366 start_codon:yes stop_codon:yes gene_type:complete
MKKQITIQERSFEFAISIIKIYRILNENREYVLSKQLLRSGTSVGANIREAQNAESKKDFIHKLAISQKECDESIYWIELLFKTGYIENKVYTSLNLEASSILNILKSIIITSKKNLRHSK